MAALACCAFVGCVVLWRQAANRVRVMLVAWLVGPDAAAYLCYNLADDYHLAGGELVAWDAVLLAMCPRGDLLWPGVAVFGLGCLFALVSYLTFYLFLWDLSSVYFLSMLFHVLLCLWGEISVLIAHSGRFRIYFGGYIISTCLYLFISTFLAVSTFLSKVINRIIIIVIII